jgi:hypothetical protein
MRRLAEVDRIRRFMAELGRSVVSSTRVYLTGGASAVLMGWRETTVDIDFSFVPELDEVYRALPDLKESLQLNLELASPAQFLPELPGWQERSPFIAREGTVDFHHYDFYAQALSKIERGHDRDRADVASMLAAGLVEPARLRALFDRVEPELYRYPAVDPRSLKRALAEALRSP